MARIKIAITEQNEVAVAVMDGTFEEASAEIKALVARLGGNVKLVQVGEIEQHRHDPVEEVTNRVHSHQ